MHPQYTSHLGEALVEHICEHCGKRRYITPWEATRGPSGRRFCSTPCYMAWRALTPEKFWSQVEKTETCWLWTGIMAPLGYGLLKHRGRMCKAHRIAYELAYGPIPVDRFVLHSCDVRHCVRPDHLRLGTHKENMADMVRRRRQATGDHVPVAHRKRGERQWKAKLTAQQVEAIRQAYAAGGVSQQALADQYGVHQTSVSYVVRRVFWKHIP